MITTVRQARIESFPLILFLSHRIEYITDSELRKDDLTSKQFLVLVAIERLYDRPPSISELAESLSTTHQNIKQIALQLQRKGFISMRKDEIDKRRRRLEVTNKNKEYWDSRAKEHETIVLSLFDSLPDKEVVDFHSFLLKLVAGTEKQYKSFRG